MVIFRPSNRYSGVDRKFCKGQKMARYQIQIRGHLDKRWEVNFPDYTIIHQFSQDGQPLTLMVGEASDQSALYGVISHLRNLGVELISVLPQSIEDDSSMEEK
jgi:hypothetical protein